MTPFRRPVLGALLALSFTGGLAGCGEQTRNGNPEVEGERLDQRREPPDASGGEAAPTSPGTGTETQPSGG